MRGYFIKNGWEDPLWGADIWPQSAREEIRIWRKHFPDRENGRFKDPKKGVNMICSKNSIVAQVAGVEESRTEWSVWEVSEINGALWLQNGSWILFQMWQVAIEMFQGGNYCNINCVFEYSFTFWVEKRNRLGICSSNLGNHGFRPWSQQHGSKKWSDSILELWPDWICVEGDKEG